MVYLHMLIRNFGMIKLVAASLLFTNYLQGW